MHQLPLVLLSARPWFPPIGRTRDRRMLHPSITIEAMTVQPATVVAGEDAAQRRPDAAEAEARRFGREGLAPALVFLFAVRWGAWAIALIQVGWGHLSDVNTRHEPLLLALTSVQILAGTAYVPFLRPRISRLMRRPWPHARDLVAIGVADVVLSLAVLYFSGGWASPYYQFLVTSLLVPTFLLNRRRSALLLAGFLLAYAGVIATAGNGLDGNWRSSSASDFAGDVIAPVLVVVVVQYLSELTYRLNAQRQQARRALDETAMLYGIAQAVAADDDAEQLVAHTCRALQATGRFDQTAVFSLAGERLRLAAQAGDNPLPTDLPLGETERQALSRADRFVLLRLRGPATSLCLVPVQIEDATWGAIGAGRSEGVVENDVRFVRAVAGQLSLGLTKISLSRQKEELAAQEERTRIAREIHDGIAQSVYMMSLNLEKAADDAKDESKLGTRLAGLVGLAKETLLEVRHYIFDLKPLLSGDQTLATTVRNQVQEFVSVTGLPVDVTVEGPERQVPVAVATALYRITQEALSNVYRHADAGAVTLRLTYAPDAVSLEVGDDGCGFALNEGRAADAGRGLRNIHHRASELGGCAEITSERGRGTRVRVTLPTSGKGET